MTEKNEYISALEQALINRLSTSEVKKWINSNSMPYKELMAYYKCAIMEAETKFNVLNEELSLKYDRNPIESIKSRLKSPESIMEKTIGRKLPLSVDSIEENIKDIAGLRVVCSSVSDIYMLAEAFLSQDDVFLVEKKDYIKNPKTNGYRSLQLIIKIPIFLHDKKKMMNVEIQMRTIPMDWWASLEHKVRYKKESDTYKNVEAELLECAHLSRELDKKTEYIFSNTKF